MMEYIVQILTAMIVDADSMDEASIKGCGELANTIEEQGVSVTSMKNIFTTVVNETYDNR